MVIINHIEMIIVINRYTQLHLNLLIHLRFTLKSYSIGYYSVIIKYYDKASYRRKLTYKYMGN